MFSLATLPLWALDHQGSLDKHLDFSDDCEEPLPSTSGQTSQRRGGVPAPMETVTLLVPHQQGLTTPGPHFLRVHAYPQQARVPACSAGWIRQQESHGAAPTLAKVGLPGTGSSKQAILSTHMCAPEYSLLIPPARVHSSRARTLPLCLYTYLLCSFLAQALLFNSVNLSCWNTN